MIEKDIVISNIRNDAVHSFYTALMHVNSVSYTAMFTITMWLLLTKTPAPMKIYRCYLVNVSNAHNWLLGMTGASVVYALCYRLAAIHNKIHILHSQPWLIFMGLLQLLYTAPCAIITLALHKPEEELLQFMRQNFPEVADFYEANSCSIITTARREFLPYIAAAFALIIAVTVCAIIVISLLLRGLAQLKGQISSKTLEMHRYLTRALLLQAAVPTGMLTVCYFMFATIAVVPSEHTRGLPVITASALRITACSVFCGNYFVHLPLLVTAFDRKFGDHYRNDSPLPGSSRSAYTGKVPETDSVAGTGPDFPRRTNVNDSMHCSYRESRAKTMV